MDDLKLAIVRTIALSSLPAFGILTVLGWFEMIDSFLFAYAMIGLFVTDLGLLLYTSLFPIESNLTTIKRPLATIERKNVNKKTRCKTIEKPSHAIERGMESSFQSIEKTIETPSKDNLAKLKEALNLKYGFLKYKESGDKVYHVFYVPELKRQKWKIIGTWTELKVHLEEQLLPLIADP